jgi:hypothetical protein
MYPTGEQELLRLELSLGYSEGDGIADMLGDFELDWLQGLALYDNHAGCNLVSVSNMLLSLPLFQGYASMAIGGSGIHDQITDFRELLTEHAVEPGYACCSEVDGLLRR